MMKHRKVTYTNSKGESVVFSPYSPYILEYIYGLSEMDVNNQRQRSPYQDGATKIDTHIRERDLGIEFGYKGTQEEIADRRRYLSKVFNPKLTPGVLRYEDFDGAVFEIDVEVYGPPTAPRKNVKGIQTSLIQLEAPDPYWKSTEQVTEPLAAFVPSFRFPFSFPVRFGERGSEAVLYNDGHVPAPIQIEFNGPAEQPVITNRTTGEFIRVNRTLADGEKLIIHTGHGRDRRVVIDRGNGVIENAFHYIDIWESTLFFLEVGENIIEHDALSGEALVNISFKKQYVGV